MPARQQHRHAWWQANNAAVTCCMRSAPEGALPRARRSASSGTRPALTCGEGCWEQGRQELIWHIGWHGERTPETAAAWAIRHAATRRLPANV